MYLYLCRPLIVLRECASDERRHRGDYDDDDDDGASET